MNLKKQVHKQPKKNIGTINSKVLNDMQKNYERINSGVKVNSFPNENVNSQQANTSTNVQNETTNQNNNIMNEQLGKFNLNGLNQNSLNNLLPLMQLISGGKSSIPDFSSLINKNVSNQNLNSSSPLNNSSLINQLLPLMKNMNMGRNVKKESIKKDNFVKTNDYDIN